MIKVTSLSHGYGTTPVLTGLDLLLPRGETMILSGPSGVGKTTLIRLIAGLELPDRGRIEIDGKAMNHGSRLVPPHRRSIGLVFQQPALWPHMSVVDHLEFVATGRRSDRKR